MHVGWGKIPGEGGMAWHIGRSNEAGLGDVPFSVDRIKKKNENLKLMSVLFRI